jgi:type I restriction enzyme R subunit
MPPTDVSEKGLEAIIASALTGVTGASTSASGAVHEPAAVFGGSGYVLGDSKDFDRDHAVDLAKLIAFLEATQPKVVEAEGLRTDGPKRQQFLHRLQGEIAKHGVIAVLRKGFKHGPTSVVMFYARPSPGNARAAELFRQNVFSITRQLHFSKVEGKLSLDLCLFINGLPVATFELKNSLTKQTVADAVEQYKRDRDPRELLFQFKRCAVHLAVDDQEVKMCTELKGTESWFLPFNKGFRDGAGNPPNAQGLKTDYLWKEILSRDGLSEILENYAQVVEAKDAKGRRKVAQIFPRYHQLDVVRALLADARAHGAGKRYLIQHSAGSGKSNSIAWLAHQLIDLEKDAKRVFDCVIVVTDRRVLDKQIRETIRQFLQVSSTMGAVTEGAAESKTSQLTQYLREGKRLVTCTVQTFPHVLDRIGSEHRGKSFAIIIDEAHSGQGGRASAKMQLALSEHGEEQEEETTEDRINRIMESRKMLTNASYFAFTATPKSKTLTLFGIQQHDGTFHPFHKYTMKQAIEEGFIMDVLKHYTPVESYYRLEKKIEDDPEFDVARANKKLKAYVEGHKHAIREKAEIMIDHFHDQVLAKKRIGGKARAMVVCKSIRQAMEYKEAFDAYLAERKSPWKAIVAFSGEHDFAGQEKVNEAKMNGFPSSKIEETFAAEEVKGIAVKHPYRFLICAEKFQTGYDEPLLHTMYVDKVLSDIKAVQTLSRLNRAHPQKRDVFVLDFVNDTDTIQEAFSKYYRTTILSREPDPNKLHDLKTQLDESQVYTWAEVESLVGKYVAGAARPELDPILDLCRDRYSSDLDEDAQVKFKGSAKMFVRTYSFLAAVLPYTFADWEYLSTFLTLLIPKLPAPKKEDLSEGVLESVDMESYRLEVREQLSISLADKDGVIEPPPLGAASGKSDPEIDRLSNILKAFNTHFGNIQWLDADKIRLVITEEIPRKVDADRAYQNARKHSDAQNARIEHDSALHRVMTEIIGDHLDLYKRYSDDDAFQKKLRDFVFDLTYGRESA